MIGGGGKGSMPSRPKKKGSMPSRPKKKNVVTPNMKLSVPSTAVFV